MGQRAAPSAHRELRHHVREMAAIWAPGTQHAPHGHSSGSDLNPPVSHRRDQGRSQRSPPRGLCHLLSTPQTGTAPRARRDSFTGGVQKEVPLSQPPAEPRPGLAAPPTRRAPELAEEPRQAGNGRGASAGRVAPAASGVWQRTTMRGGVQGDAHLHGGVHTYTGVCTERHRAKPPRSQQPSGGARGRPPGPRDGSAGAQPRLGRAATRSPKPPARRIATRCCPRRQSPAPPPAPGPAPRRRRPSRRPSRRRRPDPPPAPRGRDGRGPAPAGDGAPGALRAQPPPSRPPGQQPPPEPRIPAAAPAAARCPRSPLPAAGASHGGCREAAPSCR